MSKYRIGSKEVDVQIVSLSGLRDQSEGIGIMIDGYAVVGVSPLGVTLGSNIDGADVPFPVDEQGSPSVISQDEIETWARG